MNKHRYRVIFNKARGCLIAVAESAVSHHKGAGSKVGKLPLSMLADALGYAATLRPMAFTLLMLSGQVLLIHSAHADGIVADNAAPTNQQPVILETANGIPQVNIQSPSAAGVSRNTYSQFDVGAPGAILNNSRSDVQTQLGGYVQANPYLATGTARVILNEVNSSNPSLLNGYVEVAGSRAQVVIANPAGISCNGCGFINANRATLTTGTAIFNNGNLEGYRVQRGTINIFGNGMDSRQTDYTDILARAVQVNANLFANDLRVTTGSNQVNVASDGSVISTTPISSTGTAPSVAIDVAQLGGMYAGKIYLIGTEAGVGVTNAGHIGASAGEVRVDVNGILTNAATAHINSRQDMQINASSGITNAGTLYALGNSTLRTQGDLNTTGTLAALGNISLTADGASSAIHSSETSRIAAGLDADGRLTATSNLDISATNALIAQGQYLTQGNASLIGRSLDMRDSQARGNNLTLNASQGNIDASGATIVAAGMLTANAYNHNGQVLITDHAKVAANQFSLQMSNLSNVEGEIIQTGSGDTAIVANSLNNSRGYLNNTDGRIASNGFNLTLAADQLTNTRGSVEHAGISLFSIAANTLMGDDGQLVGNGMLLATVTGRAQLDRATTTAHQLSISSDSLSNVAGRITQSGSNASRIQVTQAIDNTQGSIASNGDLNMLAASINNTSGTLQAAGLGNVNISTTGNIINALGQISAAQDVTLSASTLAGNGKVMAGRDTSLSLQGNYTNTASNQLSANRNLSLSVTGTLTNVGTLQAVDNLSLSAVSLVNDSNLGAGADLTAYVNSLTNRGSIVGDHVAINANQNIQNDGASALIGAITSLALNVGNQLDNINGATLYSQGSLTIAADALRDSTGALAHSANLVNNISSLIEAEGSLEIATHQLNNIRNNVNASTVTTLDQTVVMSPPSWRQILTGGTSYYSTVSSNYVPQEVYYVNPSDILESSSYITPDGYVIGRVVINTHANDSAFFVATSGAYGGYAHRNRITGSDGTRVLYYFSREDNQSNPDQVAGANGNLYAPIESRQPFYGWDGAAPAFNASYGTCTTNCVRLVTEPGYTDPLNRFARNTERVLGPHIALYENRRDAHHVIKEDRLNSNVGQEASILSGGDMRISYDKSLTNHYGKILSAANLALDAAPDAATINQGLTLYRHHSFDGRFRTIDGNWYNYTRPSISEVIGTVGGTISGSQQVSITGRTFSNIDTTSGTNPNILSGLQTLGAITTPANGSGNIPVLQGALYQANPNPQASYLYETDPRFTNYRQWLSSDYLLQQLSFDPATTQKRIGDGFYEQKLVRDQVAQLTGRSFLQGYSSAEAQYQAMMNSGVTVARQYNLIPGVALSAAQVAALTSDIVWLTTQMVTLADGSTQEVLVPKVYLAQGSSIAITAGGALVTGNDVRINTNSIQNQGGQLVGNTRLALVANTDIINTGGTISGGTVNLLAGRNILNQTLPDTEQHRDGINTAYYVSISNQASISASNTLTIQAGQDIINSGATIKSTDTAELLAGRDIRLESIASEQHNSMQAGRLSNSQSAIQQHGSQIGAGGNLSLSAGQDIQLVASQINGQADINLNAGRDISLASAANESKSSLYSDYDKTKSNHNVASITQQGSEINGQGNLRLQANRDVALQASNLIAEQAISVSAGNNISLTSANNETQQDYSSVRKKSGFLSKKTTTTQDSWDQVTAIGSTISGDSISMVAGALPGNTGGINIAGSNVVATNDTHLNATGNISITSAQNLVSESHFKDTKKSGLMSSGGIGFSIGKQQLTNTQAIQTVTNTASTIGSINGDVTINAGKAYTQTGSDVLAPQGDINITAQSVDINAAQNTSVNTQQTKFKQTGITVSVSNPVISAVQTASQMANAASQTSDGRMQALAAGTSALAAKNAYDAVNKGMAVTDGNLATKAGGIDVSISFGTSKSQSDSTQTSSVAQGSNVTAGRDINITATGAGTASNLNVIGSTITAADDVTLKADNQINLLAAQNTDTLTSSNKSSSASVGASFGLGAGSSGLSLNASMSKGKGNANGTDVSYTETQVIAGNKASDKAILQSGTDTNLIGAEVKGNQVVVNIGTSGTGNLNIQSLQDTSTYNSQQKTNGISLSVPIGAGTYSGSINGSKSNINSDYASVNEQAGIKAGDAGFQISVNGNTNLIGAIIGGSKKAIDDDLNSLITQTLTTSTIQNTSDYNATSENSGINLSFDNTKSITRNIGNNLVSLAGALTPDIEKQGSESSVTHSAISQGTVIITDSAKQQELTGANADTTVANLDRDTEHANPTALIRPDISTIEQTMAAESTIISAATQELTKAVNNYYEKRIAEYDEQYKQKIESAQTKEAQAKELTANGDTQAANKLISEAQSLRAQAVDIRNERDNPTVSQGLTLALGSALISGLGTGQVDIGNASTAYSIGTLGDKFLLVAQKRDSDIAQGFIVTCNETPASCAKQASELKDINNPDIPLEQRIQELRKLQTQADKDGNTKPVFQITIVDSNSDGNKNIAINGILNEPDRAMVLAIGHLRGDKEEQSLYLSYNDTQGGFADLLNAAIDKYTDSNSNPSLVLGQALIAAKNGDDNAQIYLYAHSGGTLISTIALNSLGNSGQAINGLHVDFLGPAASISSAAEAAINAAGLSNATTEEKLNWLQYGNTTGLPNGISSDLVQDYINNNHGAGYYNHNNDPVATLVGGNFGTTDSYQGINLVGQLSGSEARNMLQSIMEIPALLNTNNSAHSTYRWNDPKTWPTQPVSTAPSNPMTSEAP